MVYRRSQSGQIGVIILLIMVVLLTIGLSIAAQTSQELALTQQNVESARVFNAAEAGIEEALTTAYDFQGENVTNNGTLATPVDGVDVNYSVTRRRELETRLFEGLTVMIDVAGVTSGQNLTIDWARDNACAGSSPPASLLFSIYYNDAGTLRMRTATVEGCDHGDGFTLPTSTANAGGYWRHHTLPLQTNDLFIRLKPLYADTDIRVTASGWTLPFQFYTVRSEATSTIGGDETRIVQVNQTLPAAPSILDYTVYSGTTITK